MKIDRISIRNFRRLENVNISIEPQDTVFVGPNNSGKTSATAIFRAFASQRGFRIHDFSVSRIADINTFGTGGDETKLPKIELDIWFAVNPDTIEYGRAILLLPNLTENFERLGIRLSYQVISAEKLLAAYNDAYPPTGESPSQKSLSEFLAQEGMLSHHFEIRYASLEGSIENPKATGLAQSEGRNLLQGLIRIDFVDAQRNIEDDETSRSNRLSNAFASFYQKNLDQAEVAAEANKVIDDNNQRLTDHYEIQFKGLMSMIKGLGVPSINDRDLKIVSSLSPESALRGSTDLLYIDSERNHHLPELYNGLGFKNLIYMTIEAKHFHSQWARTTHNRPLCQIIFIEEPEVHLHAQVQQAFIKNIWKVIHASAEAEGAADLLPQLIITTHSSHILDAAEFGKVRYFRRCFLEGEDSTKAKVQNATKILSLRDFKPEVKEVEGVTNSEQEILEFLKRYLRLTHCDLFFADAAILVEGSVEKLLLPTMIDKTAEGLNSSYLTVLEIGGAFAHRFVGLLEFLCIPYLIITDLDSVSPEGKHPACRGDAPGALTSNASLKEILGLNSVEGLMKLGPDQKCNQKEGRYITFQQRIEIVDRDAKKALLPRTIEESFIYQNFHLLRSGQINLGLEISSNLEQAYQAIFEHVKSDRFKKTDFALEMLSSVANWDVPNYIAEGLHWLDEKLHKQIHEA